MIINKKAQSELITTVLLILIGIAAVALVSTFVIGLVRNNLKNTDCLETTGQLSINIADDFTFYSSSAKILNISIRRESKEFNLTGISLVYGTQYSTKKIKLEGTSVTGVKYIQSDGVLVDTLQFPEAGETKAYSLDLSSFGADVTKVEIYPIINGREECGKSDERTIPLRA